MDLAPILMPAALRALFVALAVGLGALPGTAQSAGRYLALGERGATAGRFVEGDPLGLPLEFTIRNEQPAPRTETFRASVPFPRGAYTTLDQLSVDGHTTAWQVLQRWPDGSVRIGQAQFTTTLGPWAWRLFRVSDARPALTGAFTPHPWVEPMGSSWGIGAQVRDTFDVPYRSTATGDGELLQSSPLVRVRRWRTYHTAVAAQTGIGRDFLTSTFHVTDFRDSPLVLVDWVLGNDYLGADAIPAGNTDPNLRPLGVIDCNEARFLVRGCPIVHAYRATSEGIGAPEAMEAPWFGMPTLASTYLDDGETKRWRFVVGFAPAGTPQATVDALQQTASLMAQWSCIPLATQQAWQRTHAAGLVGGPLPGPADAWQRAEHEYYSWLAQAQFGPFGNHGDLQVAGTGGTPRNGPLSPEFAHAIQADHHRLLVKLEQKAWIQALRPVHLYGLQVGAEDNLMIWEGVPIPRRGARDYAPESLGRRALWAADPYAAHRTRAPSIYGRAHGWEHYSIEHWSTDLLFDYWTVTGDAWAQEELRQWGETLKATMRLATFYTATIQAVRAEGWCMQGFAQAHLATGDPAMREYALRRAREVVDAQRPKAHPSRAICFQRDYPATTFPMPHRFYAPWQHAAFVYGYVGAFLTMGDPLFLELAECAPHAVAYGWVTNVVDPVHGFVANGLRYHVPVEYQGQPIPPDFFDADPGIGVRWGTSPLGGAHQFLTGSLHLLAEVTMDEDAAAMAEHFARLIRGPWNQGQHAWDKWEYCTPAQYAR